MEKGSNRILAYKLAVTIYNLNLHNFNQEIYPLHSETPVNLIFSSTSNKSFAVLDDLNSNL